MVTCGCTCGNSWRLVVVATMFVAMLFAGGCDAGAPREQTRPAAQLAVGVELGDPTGDEPTAAEPVIWSAAVVPATAVAGAEVVVEIRARMAAGWTIHPVDASPGPASPTTLNLELPPGVEAVGDWELPPTRRPLDKPGSGAVYEGEVTFRQTLRVDKAAAAGALEIRCEVGFQACDAEMCRRPEKVSLVANVRVVE